LGRTLLGRTIVWGYGYYLRKEVFHWPRKTKLDLEKVQIRISQSAKKERATSKNFVEGQAG